LDITIDRVDYYIRKLKKDGAIYRIGGDKGGSWMSSDDTTDKNIDATEKTTEKSEVTTEKTTEKTEVATEKTTDKAGNTTEKILALIKSRPEITKKEIAEILHITEDGVDYHIRKLKKDGIIYRVGGDKGGSWRMNDK
ncbi:MAG: winged helix-turn-helix domain-containing protein, partial [Bacteroidales bacterium]|nr:winged helix-turn-helix domain-containing protein [Bacteroidales bacterium]